MTETAPITLTDATGVVPNLVSVEVCHTFDVRAKLWIHVSFIAYR